MKVLTFTKSIKKTKKTDLKKVNVKTVEKHYQNN
jgi:hypothetical protein